jgi:hypothetical protein
MRGSMIIKSAQNPINAPDLTIFIIIKYSFDVSINTDYTQIFYSICSAPVGYKIITIL